MSRHASIHFLFAPVYFLAAISIALTLTLMSRTIADEPAPSQQEIKLARAFCARQEQAQYCFEVAMQEGLERVVQLSPSGQVGRAVSTGGGAR